jgi:ABC-2 type transport system permease protein
MKLLATIKKDLLLLRRDRVGLALLFGMPVLLVLIVTSIQNNAFPGGKGGSLLLLVQNRDTGRFSRELMGVVENEDRFRVAEVDPRLDVRALSGVMKSRQAALTVLIPADFSVRVDANAQKATNKSLRSFGLEADTIPIAGGRPMAGSGGTKADAIGPTAGSVDLLFNAGVDATVKASAKQALDGALQAVQSRVTVKLLYLSINGKQLSDSLENDMMGDRIAVRELSPDGGGAGIPLNATQHNVPAWTIFAMFFVVMSLGGSVVRERTGGSIVRLRTLPTNFLVALFSKELVYLGVTFLQALVIFALGVWAFPLIGLPALRLPADGFGLVVVTILCGWCAVSYALIVGVFARTQEQSNGFGAISVVILAILGGLMVPAFIMPDTFKSIMRFSPLHWALECYYGLFLEGGQLPDILVNIVPLTVITLLMQFIVVVAIKRKRLI